MRFGVQILARAEIWFKISAPPEPPNQPGYEEYTDCTQPVGRWDGVGEDWPPPSYAEAKEMKSLTLHTHGCPGLALGTGLLPLLRSCLETHFPTCLSIIAWNLVWPIRLWQSQLINNMNCHFSYEQLHVSADMWFQDNIPLDNNMWHLNVETK